MIRRLWLAVLMLALVAPAALASVPRSEAALGAQELAPLSLERALATGDAVDSSSGFVLFRGDELRPQPLTVVEPSYPETRVGAFDFLGTPLVGVPSGVSHGLHWGCGDSWLGTSEGIGNFLSEDPLGDVDSPNRYAYVGWRPNEFVDPTGEGAWNPLDWASLGLGLWSFGNNLSEGNFGWAAVDLLGIAADTAGLIYQLPTGAGSIIAGSRAARVVHGIQTASHLVNAGQGIYQAGQELRQGNDGAAAFYSVTSALGLVGASRSIAHGFGYEFRPMRGTANSGIPITLGRAEGRLTQAGLGSRLQAHVDRAVAELSENPNLARDLMSEGSYRQLVKDTNLASANFGKAVERLTARFVADDEVLRDLVNYTGRSRGALGRFVVSADFTPKRVGFSLFDVTTFEEVAKHTERYRLRGLGPVEYLTYRRPSGIRFLP